MVELVVAQQKDALIVSEPYLIGNADGVDDPDRHPATLLAMKLRRRDLQVALYNAADRYRRVRLEAEIAHLDEVWDEVNRAVNQPELPHPDVAHRMQKPRAIGYNHLTHSVRMVFGADRETAAAVTWIVHNENGDLPRAFGAARNHSENTMRLTGSPDTATVAWFGIGESDRAAEQLTRNLAGFDGYREAANTSGDPLPRKDVFGYRDGNVTVALAARADGLPGVTQVLMIAPPRSLPVRHADELGMGAGNVLVQAASADVRAALAPGTAPAASAPVDPLSADFGAIRVDAEP